MALAWVGNTASSVSGHITTIVLPTRSGTELKAKIMMFRNRRIGIVGG
jgi:hypothetical protein